MCLPCGGNSTYDSTVLDCICPLNMYVLEKYDNGAFLDAKQCASCDPNAYQGPNNRAIYECASCNILGMVYTETTIPWTCECLTTYYTSSNGICIPNTDLTNINTLYPIANARTINYYYVETVDSTTLSQVSIAISDTFDTLYNDAAVGCSVYNNP